jgi:hypothetical protein
MAMSESRWRKVVFWWLAILTIWQVAVAKKAWDVAKAWNANVQRIEQNTKTTNDTFAEFDRRLKALEPQHTASTTAAPQK